MNQVNYLIPVIAGVFTILGVITGAFITYYFALKLADRNARREAGRRLREAFAPALAVLHPTSGDADARAHTDKMLADAFPKHRAAITEFGFYLSAKEREEFEEAWRKYYEVGGSVRFFDYMPNLCSETRGANGELVIETGSYECFQERVHTILKFTNK
jgi:hypothetical protein